MRLMDVKRAAVYGLLYGCHTAHGAVEETGLTFLIRHTNIHSQICS